jgi:universal stress protein A
MILLPTDFGPSFPRAAAYAGALARDLDASVHLVHVLEEPATASGTWPFGRSHTALGDQLYYDCRDKLAVVAAAMVFPSTDNYTIEVRTGTPAEAIIAAAIAYGADLIVMSEPPRSGLSRLMTASVADRVMRAAPCPVLAIRDSGAARYYASKRAA